MSGVDQRKIYQIFLVFLAMFSFALCISSFVSVQQCYTTPCYSGKGLDTLWSVDGGVSFQVVGMSLASFAHVFGSYWILFKSQGDMKKGMLIGVTAVLSLFLLIQSVFWGQESNMVAGLDYHLNGYQFYQDSSDCNVLNSKDCNNLSSKSCVWVNAFYACQKAMSVNDTTKAKFDAVTVFSVLLSLTQATFCYILHTWSDDSLEAQTLSKQRSQAAQQSTQFQTTLNPQDDQTMTSYQTENVRL
eukprot:c30455_g1_i1.p1 GENE.c30455_g1_i1~~c30455_g1_i1.p1  ORF type:complete len:244 (-),score=87.02 c30455_g1_i1:72-803(-)